MESAFSKIAAEYAHLKGRCIRVYHHDRISIGILDDIAKINDATKLILKPSIISEELYDKDGNRINFDKIERDLPVMIQALGVSKVEPLGEGYLEKLVESVNGIHNYKEFIGNWYDICTDSVRFTGKIKEMKKDYIILNPYVKSPKLENDQFVLVNEDYIIRNIHSKMTINLITETEIKKELEKQNNELFKRNEKNKLLEELEMLKLKKEIENLKNLKNN